MEAAGMTYRIDEQGLLWVVFDTPGERVNLLTADILQALHRLVEEARRRTDVRGMLFTSAKPGMFVAGMDVEQIASVTDSHRGAEAARFGQNVFQRIADLEVPTICCIGGTCLGGGTELALACDLRVAADDSSIGLPEVQIGIIPGFGGTQRLPRLIGLTPALNMILAGRAVDSRKARKLGLVDLVVPAEYLEREAAELMRRAVSDGTRSVVEAFRKRPGFVSRTMAGSRALRGYILEQARKRTAAKINARDYPAPFRAIEAIEFAYSRPLAEGLDLEARVIGELIPSRTTKNLIWLFKSRSAVKSDPSDQGAPARRVDKIAVLGAGIMGGGIAQLAADRGVPVRLKDVRYDALLSALQTAYGVWKHKLDRRRITRREVDQRMANIAPTLDYSGFRHVDLVIEAVVEKLEVKQQVLAEMERRLGERAVFASNTSSLPIGEIAARAHHPERVVGMHFFNPVHRMPLVEVIAGRESSPEAVATVRELTLKMGKVPVVVKDGPGFLVNRILSFYINEAVRLLTEGVRIEAADQAMVEFGLPMGPFALLDQIGLDTARHAGQVMQEALGPRAGSDSVLLNTLVGDDRLGKKTGRGFYGYRRGKRAQPDTGIYELIGSPAPREVPPETIQERLVLAMVNEAAICLEEGVVRQPRDVDLAMVMGTGFPPFRGGLLRHADAVGIPIVVDRLSRLADAHGERFRPSEGLQLMVRQQRRFYSTP